MLSTDLYKIKNSKLTEIITQKFENHPATIIVLIGTKDSQFSTKKHKSWDVPSDIANLKEEIDKKNNDYLDLYFTKLETKKQNWLSNVESNQFIKFVFTPLIEVGIDDEIYLYFVTLTVYQNGSIIIELFEDLRESFYNIDFLYPYTKMAASLFPDFTKKKKSYSLNSAQQLDDILNYIIKELSSINGGIQLSERFFMLHFITNMSAMNTLEFFKKDKLYTWMINAPYSLQSLSSKEKSRHYLTNYFNLEPINYINKGANYIIWNSDNSSDFESNFLQQASFFLSSATPFFQLICLEETIMDGLEKFHLSNEKHLIRFNEWVHNYKKSSLFMYRLPIRSVFDLFSHLKENSDFAHDEYIEKLKQEELSLIKEKHQFNDSQNTKIMEIMLFIIGSVSIIQVIDILLHSYY
ncbi:MULTISPECIES: hypothetical protein [unclassified Streptococcus]|uniref:hypothetical protein n=1 Tax=unclassified Streptococcus TaxID=2608887 RepID=UPI000AC198E7|nr:MULTISPECIES: hypothetical protein [unclassified Streptococcus]